MQTAKIRLRKPTRVFTFLCEDLALKRDDKCIVRSDRGLEFGICIVPSEDCPEGMKELIKMSVVRKATLADETTFSQIQRDEDRARQVCAQKIAIHKLPMKLVDAEYTFDKHKVVFYFTAAERVDFRKLVRDLAQELKTRIELRHIQVRDEAKLVGGLGVCGRELCCASWLTEFQPISMKMAKRQSLSLNPSKISGQCGRLLCCLAYENDQYPDPRRMRAAARAEAIVEEPEETAAALEDDAAVEKAEDIVVAEAVASAPPAEPREQPSEKPSGEQKQPAAPEERKKGKRRSRKRRRHKSQKTQNAASNSGKTSR